MLKFETASPVQIHIDHDATKEFCIRGFQGAIDDKGHITIQAQVCGSHRIAGSDSTAISEELPSPLEEQIVAFLITTAKKKLAKHQGG